MHTIRLRPSCYLLTTSRTLVSTCQPASVPEADEAKETGEAHSCPVSCWVNTPTLPAVMPRREDPSSCSPGHARLKHSYQRSHLFAQKPSELMSCVHVLWEPWGGENREGVWCGGNGTAYRVAADWRGSWERGCISLDFQSSLPIRKAGFDQITKGPVQLRKLGVSLTSLQRRKHITYVRTFQDGLVTDNLRSRDMSAVWPPGCCFWLVCFFKTFSTFSHISSRNARNTWYLKSKAQPFCSEDLEGNPWP